MVYTHVVLRPFQAEGVEVQPGDFVDASRWKNTAKLVSCQPAYLRPMNDADRPASKAFAGRTQKALKKVLGKTVQKTAPKKKFIVRRKA